MLKRKYLSLIILVLFINNSNAQDASEREWTIFQKGLNEYEQGQFTRAEENFSLVISKLPDTRLLTANYLMLAKSRYKVGKYNESIQTCREFIQKFPESNYSDDIYYVKANANYRLSEFKAAVADWLTVVQKNKDSRLAKKALDLAEKTIRFRLDKQAIAQLQSELKAPYPRQIFLYNAAEHYYHEGNSALAISMLNEFNRVSPESAEYTEKAKRLSDIISDKKKNALCIAALLPLTGANEEVGRSLLNGAKMAVKEYNGMHDFSVELIHYDYETNLTVALQKMKEIAADGSIIAVFGPLENDITAACAVISDYEKVPLLTPTATEDGLINLSTHLMQLAPPVSIYAEHLAEFAHDSLGMKRIVTLAPIEDYFLKLLEKFVQKAEVYDTEVISQQWYYPGDQNMDRQFKSIKRIGLKLAFQDSLSGADSTITIAEIDSLYKIYMKEEKLRLEETHTVLDSADIPVTTFDGIFMPIYKDDINYIAPQFAYHNIQAQILGNGDWYDIKALKKNKNYLNGLIFISDGYVNEESWDYKQFRNNYRTTFNSTPKEFAFLGYDSFNYILSTLASAGNISSRTQFLEIMNSASEFKGIYRNFIVGSKRYNSATRILKYVYGQLVPLR